MDTKEQASQPALQTLKEYAVITAAVLIMDIGIYVFKFPNNFSFGGVSGMAVVICRFLPFTASQINLFINLLLLLVGFAVLGRNFGVKTAYVTVLSSVLLNIFEKLFPMAHPLTDEIMLELIHSGAPNIVCTQPFACLPNHVVGKGVIKELRRRHPESNIVAIDYDPGASEVNQLNRIKLMLSTAQKKM